jgi:elongation factor Ts
MTISANDVKSLREMTGAGMMDCKEALTQSQGDIEKAVEYLRKKGMASAQKRAGREAKEGIIMSYMHPGNRLGVLVEVNCETDFVAKTDEFQSFVRNVAMQVAATHPMAVRREDVPKETVDKELEIYRGQMQDNKKPPAVIEKIVTGKLDKYFQEVVLLEQSYVKDPGKTVQEYMLEVSGKLGEAMAIRRFVRFQLGE